MSTHRRESILANFAETLDAIESIESVQRWDYRGNHIIDVPCIIISSGREEKEPDPAPQATCHLTVILDLWTRIDETITTDTDQILDALLLDIEKALSANPKCGGYAEDSNIRSITPFETVDGQPHCGLTIELDVLYRHLQTDPSLKT